MPDCYCKREYLDPSVRRMRSNDGIVHGVNGCFSSGETGVGGRSWEKRALDAEEKVQRVRELCESATVTVSQGCTCYTDECSGCGYGKPLAWSLDPADILRAIDGDGDA